MVQNPALLLSSLGKKDRMKGRIRETTNKNYTDNKKK